MKALIICSVHALCDIAELERQAFNQACALHGIPAILTPKDHAHVLATTTMLDLLSHLPGPTGQRKALVASYLDRLNDTIWSSTSPAHQSVFAKLLCPKAYARPTGFVSEYPLLTTNLVRSSALVTNATKLGTLTALSDPLQVPNVSESLATASASLKVARRDVEVLVAQHRDFDAALSIGMHPRFVEERRPDAALVKKGPKPRGRISNAVIVDRPSIHEAFAISA